MNGVSKIDFDKLNKTACYECNCGAVLVQNVPDAVQISSSKYDTSVNEEDASFFLKIGAQMQYVHDSKTIMLSFTGNNLIVVAQ